MSKLPARTSIEYLKDTFKIGHYTYEDSRAESREVWNLYHNRQYTAAQLEVLGLRGQPPETFNVIKLFGRTLTGYYSTVINTVTALPKGFEDINTSTLLNDIVVNVFDENNFKEEGEQVKLGGMISGLLCSYVDVRPTGEKDKFGRPINSIYLEYVHDSEIILDPLSTRVDYADARYIHRFKWLSEEAIIALFGQTAMDKMQEYYNFTDGEDVDYDIIFPEKFNGTYRMYNNYLIVHSVVIDELGKSWSIFWHNDMILEKKEITHKEVKFPYRVVKVNRSQETEYYGIFREVIAPQKAINQALIKLQLMVSTQKVFVEDNAVENLADFTHAVNRVSGVIQVTKLAGIKVEELSRDALEQYAIIDKSLDRIKQVLGVTDSFLGQAYASDSGRKVKLQQNSSIVALRYLTGKFEAFYKFLGWDIVNLIKQYYTATQALRIADDVTGYRWAVINAPAEIFSGQIDPQTGQPIMEYEFEPAIDPASGEEMVDEDGNLIMAPIPIAETEIAFTNVDIEIQTTAFNDEDERNQLMLETMLSGPVGQFLMQVNPAGYLKASGLNVKSIKTKDSPEIAKIFEETAQMLGGNPEAQQEASLMAQGQPSMNNQVPRSQSLKLPQNTNEE